jgi:hypothetical protein
MGMMPTSSRSTSRGNHLTLCRQRVARGLPTPVSFLAIIPRVRSLHSNCAVRRAESEPADIDG